MGGQQERATGTPDDERPGETPDVVASPASAKDVARAERRSERRRRQDERRRRWSRATTSTGSTSPSGSGTTAGDGGAAVMTHAGDPGDATTQARPPATTAPAVPAGGLGALWQLLLASHPRQAVVTAAAFAGVAAVTGRPYEQIALLGAMVLVGQAILGWHNDLVDRDRDAAVLAAARDRGEADRLRHKPLAEGRLEPDTAWYAIGLATIVVVPLSVASGVTAGVTYLVVLAIGMVGNVVLRRGWLSWVPWAASYALYPAVLAYAGPTGGPAGSPPQTALVVLAALLGVVVHVLRALPGLVDDNRDGQRHLPLRLALKTGAPRLLGIAGVLAVGLAIALLTTGAQLGLVR